MAWGASLAEWQLALDVGGPGFLPKSSLLQPRTTSQRAPRPQHCLESTEIVKQESEKAPQQLKNVENHEIECKRMQRYAEGT